MPMKSTSYLTPQEREQADPKALEMIEEIESLLSPSSGGGWDLLLCGIFLLFFGIGAVGTFVGVLAWLFS